MPLEENLIQQRGETHWYAIRVFSRKMEPLLSVLTQKGVEHFHPEEVIKSLVFLKTTESFINTFRNEHYQEVWVYTRPKSSTPAIIPDKEMDIFMFVCTAGKKGMMYLGEDRPEYHVGDRVRVTEGPLKGIEGHIRRIKKDRRIIVSINGLVAVATTFIPPQFLEVIQEEK